MQWLHPADSSGFERGPGQARASAASQLPPLAPLRERTGPGGTCHPTKHPHTGGCPHLPNSPAEKSPSKSGHGFPETPSGPEVPWNIYCERTSVRNSLTGAAEGMFGNICKNPLGWTKWCVQRPNAWKTHPSGTTCFCVLVLPGHADATTFLTGAMPDAVKHTQVFSLENITRTVLVRIQQSL